MKAGTRVLVSLSLCVVMATMIASLTTHAAAKAATVVTDLSDYPPGTQVNVSGTGWLAGEVVQLTFTETSTTPPGGYTDGPFVFYATADGLGNIANGEFYTDAHDVGVTFTLTAKGSISGRTAQTTFTDSLPGLFQIDGDATGGTSTSHDWDQVYADRTTGSRTAGTLALQFTTDPLNPLDDVFANSPKDTQDISAWRWKFGAVSQQKDDLLHGFAAAYQDPSDLIAPNTCYPKNGCQHTMLYIGTDRYSSGSNGAISVWFLQNPIGASQNPSNDGTATFVIKGTTQIETHTYGDLLLQANLSNSSPPTVATYKWIGGSNPLQSIPLSPTQAINAINTKTTCVSWPFNDAKGSTGCPQAQEFFEVGLDLNELFGKQSDDPTFPDFSSFIITTRVSQSQTATLSDFILGAISSAPDVTVAKTADAPTVLAGGKVGFKVAVSNIGVGDALQVTLDDPLPAGAGTDLNWTLLDSYGNPCGNPCGAFKINGSVGSQVLNFANPQTLPFNSQPLVAHVVATSTLSDLGSIPNTATVKASNEPPNLAYPASNSASASVTVVQPALSITKTPTPKTYGTVGELISYSYKVTNSGNVALAGPVSVTDDKTTVSCATGSLAAGVSMTCSATYKITQADIDAASVTNTATAHSNGTDSATVTATVFANKLPALSIAKTPTPKTYGTVGEVISYSYKVTNTGNTTLTSAITVTDNKITTVDCSSFPAGGLAPGLAMTCTANYSIAQADIDAGSVTNTASAHSGDTNSASVDATVTATQNKALKIVKTPSPMTYRKVGDVIGYSYEVTNTGNTTLTSAVTVTDNKINTVDCSSFPAGGLAPGLAMTCAATYSITQVDIDFGSVTNTASAHSGTTNSASVDAEVTAIKQPALSLIKTAAETSFAAIGDVIHYSYIVKNVGNTTLGGPVSVSDDKAPVSCPAGGLAPGEYMTCTASYTTIAADVTAGSVTNTATALANKVSSLPASVTVPFVIATPTIGSAMRWVLHDSLKVDGLRQGAPNASAAPVTFNLYAPDNPNCVGAPINGGGNGESVAIVNGEASTVLGFIVKQSDIDTLVKAGKQGTYRWVVSYLGDSYNKAVSTACGNETHTITVGEP